MAQRLIELTLEQRLQKLSPEDWDRLRSASVEDAKARTFYHREWWHVKFYQRSDNNDGFKTQYDRDHDLWEVPFERKVFYSSPASRFGLGEQPVAYLASGPDISEAELHFRDWENLPFDVIYEWWRGRPGPSPEDYGYPLNFVLHQDAVVLDLTFHNTRLFKLVDASDDGFLREIVNSRDEAVYGQTRVLARYVSANGYHGIIWDSVRAPTDVNIDRKNLVMFDEAFIKRK